jgi:tetratricopeptide (TPR) repeat protein
VLCEYGQANYAEFGDLGKAAHLFEKSLEIDPQSVITLLYLGDLYSMGYGQGYRAALPIYQQIITLEPHKIQACVEAYIGIGMLHHVPESPVTLNEVIAAFRKATELDPLRADAHQNLGMALFEKGDRQEAWNELKIAENLLTSMGQKAENVKKTLKRIENNEPFTRGSYMRFSLFNQWPRLP